jgi:hypothetical protein
MNRKSKRRRSSRGRPPRPILNLIMKAVAAEIRRQKEAVDADSAAQPAANKPNPEAIPPTSSSAPQYQDGDCRPDDPHALMDRMRL